MSEEMQASPKRKRQVKTFSPEQARGEILSKLEKAGPKGAGSPITKSTSPAKRAVFEQVLADLEAEREIFIDRRKATPKLFLWSVRPKIPTRESVAATLEEFAIREFPRLVASSDLKTALGKDKEAHALLFPAFELLTSQGRLIILRYQKGKTKPVELYAHADSLRRTLGVEQPQSQTTDEAASSAPAAERHLTISPETVREAYRTVAARTGFPAVAIATLQQESGVPMEALKQWLIDEYKDGRAIFSFGDWSLSDETKRAGGIELNGERYLLVRLQE
ncbi:hypothetical protein ACXR0O_08380 [Verrucomicrobiota bacterium sgz303538]